MKHIKQYIYLLLFCIFLQNSNGSFVDLIKKLMHSNDELSLFLKVNSNTQTEEEKEEAEKESKENENKENESKEKEDKEKELKEFKYLNTFVFLSLADKNDSFRNPEDSALFSLDSDTETPPPKIILEA